MADDASIKTVNENIQNLTLQLLLDLEHSAICELTPRYSRAAALHNIQKLKSAVLSEGFDLSLVQPILASAIACTPDNDLWESINDAVTEYTHASSQQTQRVHNTSSFATLSEHHQYIDQILKAEIGPLYVGIPQFYSAFFGCVSGLQEASRAVFGRCMEGRNPLFVADRWEGWPGDANQEDVLTWLSDLTDKLADLSKDYRPESAQLRRPLARPNKPIQGSTEERKLDIGFVSDINAGKDTKCLWAEILVPGVLKSNPAADTAAKTWLDLGRSAREVLAAQDTRRFVLGFAICGSFMRTWTFDRLEGVASDRFDINTNGLQFVFSVLGFLWISDEQYWFDPTIIITEDGRRFIEIEQNGEVQRLFLEGVIKRTPCIAGRATTCWKAYREDDPGIPLVVKDSWQDTEHDEEGRLLQEATNAGVVNVARTATTLHHSEQAEAPSAGASVANAQHKGQSTDRPNIERPYSQDRAFLPPSKRPRLSSPNDISEKPSNRIHRRVIMRDYGKPIYTASTHSILLAALERCITGHQSLHKAGILHRDISPHNLMINENKNNNNNPSWPAFLIDLDLAIREQKDILAPESNGSKTGTRPFMAIGALMGEKHSFMHDLESFF
ncbi:protein kinase family protein [Aspergillus tubingensis]|uniref:protein kinase family protein n=1 Tax=Aspergillus tubingensis TaxID=5068 RepID=UPI0015785314|nr:salicylate synthase [Aspergillus tubingensis]GFN19185.1 salicylate synthase [Aspergillus tubingensis]